METFQVLFNIILLKHLQLNYIVTLTRCLTVILSQVHFYFQGFSAAAIVYNVFAHNYVSKPACYGETWSATTPRWGFYWCHSYGNVETYIGAALGIAAAQIGLTITFMVACLIFRNNVIFGRTYLFTETLIRILFCI